ncbi:CHASE2 domain-containing protein [Hydrogenophaga sp. OTU3427]|uniref:CHASE2 domain-containing protein n=1 Tax=Hydrogenophaga sp. OTU3427 TaxID=3043856 RepID=UPI00313C5BC3
MPEPGTLARPRPAHKLRWGEWLLLTAAVLAAVVVLDHTNLLTRTNRLLHDALVRLQPREVAHGQVVLIGIDDKSIAALGRWPWPRSLHADLIDRISAGRPAAIGLDLLLPEADIGQSANDRALAAAIAHSGKLVLPMMMQNRDGQAVVVGPLPAFQRGAAAIGHVHLPVDDDGVARSIYLREGSPTQSWPHFTVALLQTAGILHPGDPLPGRTDDEHTTIDPVSGRALDWRRSHRTQVAFAGPPGTFTRYPYVDVLDGTVAPETFRNKLVLVGATATGIGDLYATPVTDERLLMPGVEIAANLVDTLLQGRHLVTAPAWVGTLFNTLPVLLALSALAWTSPLTGLLLCLGLLLSMATVTAVGSLWLQVQLGPVAGMLGVVLAYVLWSWRRMDAATRYLVDEYHQLRDSSLSIPRPVPDGRPRGGDFLDRRINALTGVTHQLRDLHRFVSDSLDGLPDATLVCDTELRVVLANAAAARHFQVSSPVTLAGRSLTSLTADLVSTEGLAQGLAHHLHTATHEPNALETRDQQGRDLLVKWTPSFSAAGQHSGWILSLVDVTQMRAEQRQRDDAMHFLSHDMRAPQSAILTLVDLVRQDPDAMNTAQFQDRVERHARKALALADDFISLVRAQSREYVRERYNLSDLLGEVLDDAWEAAQAKSIGLRFKPPQMPADSLVDRELLQRALANLVGNAIKYSPDGTTVHCSVRAVDGHWEVAIQDEGPGIPPAAQPHLFKPFYRVQQGIRTQGTGLGLPFVQTVAVRHGGQVTLHSAPGQGARFALLLPRAIPDDEPITLPDGTDNPTP